MIDAPNDIVGHKTFGVPGGSFRHEPLTRQEADAWLAADARDARLAEEMPDVQSAINRMWEGWYRLIQLGWRDAIYCPKDGSAFEVIEAGSTGIFKCHYDGDWPKGSWWVHDGGDLWPARPTLYRALSAEPSNGTGRDPSPPVIDGESSRDELNPEGGEDHE